MPMMINFYTLINIVFSIIIIMYQVVVPKAPDYSPLGGDKRPSGSGLGG